MTRLTKAPVPASVEPLLVAILGAMQDADEIWGATDPDDYVALMHAITAEANARIGNANAMRRQLIMEQPGRSLYEDHCDNNPSVHSNRFKTWLELSQAARDSWNSAATFPQ